VVDDGVVIRRYELSDAEWDVLSVLLPPVVRGGRPRLDDRRVLNGISWKVRSGAPWRDVPARYGSWRSIYTRFRRWAVDGTFQNLLKALQADADARGNVDWLVSIDSTITRAHQHAAGAKGGATIRANRFTPSDDPVVD
jgi:transposase